MRGYTSTIEEYVHATVPNITDDRFAGIIDTSGLYYLLTSAGPSPIMADSSSPSTSVRKKCSIPFGYVPVFDDIFLSTDLDVKESTVNAAVILDRVTGMPAADKDTGQLLKHLDWLTKYTEHPDGGWGVRAIRQGKVNSERGDGSKE